MAETEKRMGRPSIWSDELGKTVPANMRVPMPIRELLYGEQTKKLLNKMALDESVKQKAWELGE